MIISEQETKNVQNPQDFVYKVFNVKKKKEYRGEMIITARDVEHANDIVSTYIQNNPQFAENLTGIKKITEEDQTGEVSNYFGVAKCTIKKKG